MTDFAIGQKIKLQKLSAMNLYADDILLPAMGWRPEAKLSPYFTDRDRFLGAGYVISSDAIEIEIQEISSSDVLIDATGSRYPLTPGFMGDHNDFYVIVSIRPNVPEGSR